MCFLNVPHCSSRDLSISHNAPLTCGQTLPHSSFQLPMGIDCRAAPTHVLMWQLKEKRGGGGPLSTDQGLSVHTREYKQIVFSDAANSKPQRAKKHPEERKKNGRWYYCSPDRKVQSVSVKSITPWMYDIQCAILGWKCVCIVCISERKQYLGLCEESVSVASKVLWAACRLLIHIHRGVVRVRGWWYSEVVEKWKERGKRERAWTNERKPCVGMMLDVNGCTNKIDSIKTIVTPWSFASEAGSLVTAPQGRQYLWRPYLISNMKTPKVYKYAKHCSTEKSALTAEMFNPNVLGCKATLRLYK